MRPVDCSSIKDSFLAHLGNLTDVHDSGGECVVTVPFNTVDNRWVDVIVMERGNDFFLVHDDGRSADELFLQGMSMTDGRISVLQSIAGRYGVNIDDGKFVVGCKRELLNHSIWTVAHCSALATAELLRHRTSATDEAAKTAVGQILTTWGATQGVRIQRSVPAKGYIAQHNFDFVAEGANVVAINVLNPSSGALARAERYGYQELDIRETYAGTWKKLAVLANPGQWSTEAKRIVSDLASKTVEFIPSSESSQSLVIEAVQELIAA